MQAEACFGQDAGHCRHRGAANSAASVADRTLQNMREIVVAKRNSHAAHCMIGTSIWHHQFQFVIILKPVASVVWFTSTAVA